MDKVLDSMGELCLQLAACVESLCLEGFYPRFFKFMESIARIEQCMVFVISADRDQADCRLAYNASNPELGLELALKYIDGNYKNDALLSRLADDVLMTPGKPACELLLRGKLSPVYRRRFFSIPDLSEKFAIAAKEEESGCIYYINFYRADKNSQFSRPEILRLEQSAPLVSSLLIRHFKEDKSSVGEHGLLSASLSEREAQICEMILRGHTAKTIGRRLSLSENSVITYRKRAYKKLNISRKSQLLDLLQQGR
jgi:DNA-binding CsgD family transcriptional regulator